MHDKVVKSFLALEQYCIKEEFQGWDPYDGLMSKVFRSLPILPGKKITRLVWIQLLKKMPINLRSVLGIKKGYNPKGLALFISGYAKLSETKDFGDKSIEKINFLANKLLDLRTPGFSGNCWGYNFDWESRAFFQKEFTPTIVATTYCANALLDAYEATKNKQYLDEAISSKNFILKDLNRSYSENGNFVFSYSPFDTTSVFNASLLGARLLSRIYHYTQEEELADVSRKAVAYCCDFQNADGSWFYSTLPFHQWIDNFHTGFNLECIYEYMKFTGDFQFQQNFDKGLKYYEQTFFDQEGRSRYYNNALYPIDIHAPAQLVVTMSKSGLFEEYQGLVNRVLNWTIGNMQSSEGYFFFQKRKYYTNKISYMRWSQAWIFYALAVYLKETADLKSSILALTGDEDRF